MWSKEDVAKRIDKEYVAVLIDVDADESTPKLYDVSAMPTLVIADADGTEVAKSVGAPFSTPDGAIKWFDEIGGKITAYGELRTKWDESKHTNAEAGEKLAAAALELGKQSVAIEVFETLIALAGDDKPRAASLHVKIGKMFLDQWDLEKATEHVDAADKLAPSEGDARIDVDVVRAKLLLFNEKPEDARKLAEKHFEPLLKATDARAIDLAEVLMGTANQDDEAAMMKNGRELYVKLAKAFEKHERVWELKVYAAWYGMSSEDAATKEAAKKEMAEIAEKGEGRWKDIAKSILEAPEKKEEGEEGGESEDDMK